jgi:NADH-quinone oxidoreductase subunit F
MDAEPTPAERAAVDGVLGPAVTGWEGAERVAADGHVAHGGHDARSRRHLLLPVLHEVQARVGWISPGALGYACRRLTVPPAEAYGVASFYALFSMEPRAPVVAHVCTDIACMCSGSAELLTQVSAAHSDGRVTVLESPCLGLCERAPAALVTTAGESPREVAVAPATTAAVASAIAGDAVADAGTPVGGDDLRLLRRVGRVDPGSLSSYRAHGGYAALRRAFDLGPAGVIREVTDSRLLGRGGAAFPTGRKWDAVARHPVRPRYVVCNADESEPGTFKDRVVIESDPFALVEAMTVAGYAVGAEHGYVYLRGEYPLAWERLVAAVDQARAHGLLGDDVMGQGVRFDVELRKGAGAYICGEETALFNSIEGFRGEPRSKPPFPVDSGLFRKPTVVNNVESLVNVLDILADGGVAYSAIGTEQSTGTRLFCLSGCVERPGLYEAPFGITLRALIDMAGGVAGGASLRAVLLGGAAGVLVGPDKLDLELSFEATRAAGATLGSGVVMLFDDTVDLAPILLRIAAFFRDESCGQCVPCRVGTVRQEEALLRLANGTPRGSVADEVALLAEVTQAMRDASICGLGQTAANVIDSAIHDLGVFA